MEVSGQLHVSTTSLLRELSPPLRVLFEKNLGKASEPVCTLWRWENNPFTNARNLDSDSPNWAIPCLILFMMWLNLFLAPAKWFAYQIPSVIVVFVVLVCNAHSQKSQGALNPSVKEERYLVPFYMSLYYDLTQFAEFTGTDCKQNLTTRPVECWESLIEKIAPQNGADYSTYSQGRSCTWWCSCLNLRSVTCRQCKYKPVANFKAKWTVATQLNRKTNYGWRTRDKCSCKS
jgi:hypothetical protein